MGGGPGPAEPVKQGSKYKLTIRCTLGLDNVVTEIESERTWDRNRSVLTGADSAHQGSTDAKPSSPAHVQGTTAMKFRDTDPGQGWSERNTSGRVYEFTDEGSVAFDDRANDLRLPSNGIIAKLVSATICATDISNMDGRLGHGKIARRVAGHESCYRVLDSSVPGVTAGQYVVILGDDFSGLAERFAFRPILPGIEIPEEDLVFDARGTFMDPKAGHKAVVVLDDWFPGASTIEAATHVYTSIQYNAIASVESIVVVGAGLCGLLACQMLRSSGTRSITLLDVDIQRLGLALDLGLADLALDPRHDLDAIQKLIYDSKGAHSDAVFDALPAHLAECPVDPRELAAKLVKPGGRWVLFGATEDADFPLLPILAKGVQVRGAPFDSRLITFEERATTMARVVRLAEAGTIRPEHLVGGNVDFFDERAVLPLFDPHRSGVPIRREIRAD